MNLTPITLREARAFVDAVHRHHRAPQGGLFAVAASEAGKVRAVAIIGRPVARNLADGCTAEVTRVASDGAPNACSMLYGAAWRAARALGYRRIVTYTLATESGGTLKAAGWRVVAETRPDTWDRADRPRVDDPRNANQAKLRWEAA